MTAETIKTLLDLVISILTLFIPWLGGVIHLPVIGWISHMAIGYLTGLLAKLITRQIDNGVINHDVAQQVADAKAKTQTLKVVQTTPGATLAEKQKALAEFKDALRKLSRFNGSGLQ